jgi:hypothetical protein
LAVGAVSAEHPNQFFGFGLQQGGRHDVYVEMTVRPETPRRRRTQFQTAQIHRGGDVVLLTEAEQVVGAAQGSRGPADQHLA